MRAVAITRPGPPEVLRLEERPDPLPRSGELRIATRAIGVNRADLLQRRGLYPAPSGVVADIPGLEFAGRVELVGPDTPRFQAGDRVMAIVSGGAYADLVSVPAGLCASVPEPLSWEEAAALPEASITAWEALFVHGRLTAGEVVLLTAAASGVGTAALQLARVGGARVVATSRSAEKRRRLEALGADRVLDPDREDLGRALRDAADGGVDLVLDLVGRPAWPSYLEALRVGGRIVVVGLLGGTQVELDLSKVLSKRLQITGTVLRTRSLEEKVLLVREWERLVLPAVATGRVRPVVDRVYPLEQAAAAHEYVERNASFGKVVLSVGGP